MKRELRWWTAFFVVGIILIGQMTEFEFRNIDIQLHDTYYIIPSWIALLVVLTILGVLRGLTKIINRLSDRNRSMAILVSIVNGIVGLVLIILVCAAILNLIQIREWYPGLDIFNYIAIIVVMILLLSVLVVIEIKTIKKLRTAKK
ncbi:MAG TPA: hypothetical protein VL443_02250 [Cyclobacteriaceae bacterium]|nr:hypothetical protein [Cyclobacteriaceae bacterium]